MISHTCLCVRMHKDRLVKEDHKMHFMCRGANACVFFLLNSEPDFPQVCVLQRDSRC